MKQFILIALIFAFAFAFSAAAQKAAPDGPQFDMADFNKKFEVVEWLVEYDNVAWQTTDVLMQQDKKDLERLGQEWFCFQDKNKVWHAVYGKLGEAGYDLIFHFVMDPAGKISRSEAKLDSDFITKHARALATGQAKLAASIPESSPRFNQYIRQNSDNTYSVWLLPAFQTNRLAVFGGEAIYTIDSTGQKIIKDESYFQPDFRGFKTEPPREIWLNYREMKKPSLGAIFFVWYYKPYFTKIFIDNEKSTSSLVKAGKEYIWVHVEKDGDGPRNAPKSGAEQKPVALKDLEIGKVSDAEFTKQIEGYKGWDDCKTQLYIINYGTDEQIAKREKLMLESDVFNPRRYDCARRTFVRGGPGELRTVIWKVPPGADNPIP